MPVRGRRYIKVYRWVRENTPLSFSGGSRSRARRSHRRRPPRKSRPGPNSTLPDGNALHAGAKNSAAATFRHNSCRHPYCDRTGCDRHLAVTYSIFRNAPTGASSRPVTATEFSGTFPATRAATRAGADRTDSAGSMQALSFIYTPGASVCTAGTSPDMSSGHRTSPTRRTLQPHSHFTAPEPESPLGFKKAACRVEPKKVCRKQKKRYLCARARKAQIVFAAGIFKHAKNATGCSAVRLAHLLWEQGVAGSNPVSPTGNGRTFRLCRFLLKDASSTTDSAILNEQQAAFAPKRKHNRRLQQAPQLYELQGFISVPAKALRESLSDWRILLFRTILQIRHSVISTMRSRSYFLIHRTKQASIPLPTLA